MGWFHTVEAVRVVEWSCVLCGGAADFAVTGVVVDGGGGGAAAAAAPAVAAVLVVLGVLVVLVVLIALVVLVGGGGGSCGWLPAGAAMLVAIT